MNFDFLIKEAKRIDMENCNLAKRVCNLKPVINRHEESKFFIKQLRAKQIMGKDQVINIGKRVEIKRDKDPEGVKTHLESQNS